MARLEYTMLRLIFNEFPDYKRLLLKSVAKYEDKRTNFLKKMILWIECVVKNLQRSHQDY